MTRIYLLVIAIYFQVGRVSPPRPFGPCCSTISPTCADSAILISPFTPTPTDRSTRTCKVSHFPPSVSTFLERSQTIFPSVLRILRFCIHLRFTRNFKMYRRNECLLFPSRGIVESNFEIIDTDIDIQAEKTRNKQSGKTRRAEREEQRPFKSRKVHLWLHRKSQVAAIFYHGIPVFTNGPRPRILHSWYRYRPPRA